MASNRIGFLTALVGVGLCGACGSSPTLGTETDADVPAGDSSSITGPANVGGAPATGGVHETSGPDSNEASGGAVATGGSPGTGGTIGPSSDPDARMASGTVAMNKAPAATNTSCPSVVGLANPAQSLVGYAQMEASAYLNDSRAGEPSYVYLDGGKDAVILPGPPVSYAAASVDVSAATLTTCVNEESDCSNRDGYRLQVNERLSYIINIDDWEEEIALGQVELCLDNGTLTTQFVFAGLGTFLGGGVAHRLTIMAILDGVSGPRTAAIDVECRAE